MEKELDHKWERYMGLGCAVAPYTHLPIYPFTFSRSVSCAKRSAIVCKVTL
jgi:hypothetical protein